MLEHSVDHFQDIAMILYCIFLKYVCQHMLKNEISINNKFCPQSVLNHSVIHFQGIAMTV